MYYENCLLNATTTVIEWDLPPSLLPLTITSQVALLAGFESDRLGIGWE